MLFLKARCRIGYGSWSLPTQQLYSSDAELLIVLDSIRESFSNGTLIPAGSEQRRFFLTPPESTTGIMIGGT